MELSGAIALVVSSLVGGAIFGWIFAYVWNWSARFK
jgi:hypothetical protein